MMDAGMQVRPVHVASLHESLRCSREPRSAGRLLASSFDLPWHVVYLAGGGGGEEAAFIISDLPAR